MRSKINFYALFKKYWLISLALIVSNVVIFWQFYFKSLLPFPGNLLITFFFPWNSGGFPGFDPWTTRKELIDVDTIRQMYPWFTFARDQLLHGQIPLWNPYNFSGYPLMANLQSAVFFPGNLISVFLPPITGWIAIVISSLTLFALFTFIFLRSLKLSFLASLFGAIAATNLGYIVVWQEQLVIIRATLFLPLILWSANKYLENKKKHLFWPPVLLALTIFAGHAQETIYVYIICFSYFIFRRISLKILVFWFVIPILLSAVQLVPTLEIYLQSAREGEATRQLFAPYILLWRDLVKIFAPDFFGNIATNNYWGRNYTDSQVYFGITTALFALMAFINLHKQNIIKFFGLLFVTGILFAEWPLVFVAHILNVPILATGVPTRIIILTQFSAVILAAFGLQWLITDKKPAWIKLLVPIGLFLIVYLFLWGITFVVHTPELLISRHNLILPSFIFLTVSLSLVFSNLTKNRLRLIILTIPIILLVFEGTTFFNKYHNFSPEKFVFPSHPVLSFVQTLGVDRFYGFGSAYLDHNFATYYHIYAPEGYDSLYIKRYGELLSSTQNGNIAKIIPRSTAVFGDQDNFYRNRVFDLLGIKYILAKNDNPSSNWEQSPQDFPPDKYELIWQQSKWKIYQRKTVLPRTFLADSYEVATSDAALISRLYSPNFSYQTTLLLEKDPHVLMSSGSGQAQIISYKPNEVKIKTQADGPKLLYLSDSYFSGWKAFVDNTEISIYRADYSFRAVPIPAGPHSVTFKYDPLSFKIGSIISGLSWTVLLTILLFA